MFSFKKKCPVCAAIESENKYLRKLVDSLLDAAGVRPTNMEGKIGSKVQKIVEDEEGSDDPSSSFGITG